MTTTVRSEAIALLQPVERDRWDSYVAAHPQGTIYHTMDWQTVTQTALGHRPYYLRALDDDGRIVGVLPLFLVGGIFGRRLVSVPMRDRGGVLATNDTAASGLIASALRLGKDLGCTYVELRSVDALADRAVRDNALECERYWITTQIDLSPGREALWKRLDRDAVRWAINNAHRRGVRVEFDDSERGIDVFYELFVRTRCSMGIPPFPKELFRAIWSHLIRRGKANLALVGVDTTPIGGMISLLSKDSFIPAYAAPQKEWRKHYPSEVVFWHTIEWACAQGFRCYDFGADSPHQTGLLRFKRKWGGVPHPMYYYRHSLRGSATHRVFDSSAGGYEWARKVWTALPTPISRTLGAWATTQLS